MTNFRFLWVFASLAAVNAFAQDGPFQLKFNSGRVVSLKNANDQFVTEYIAPKAALGNVDLNYRTEGGAWEQVRTDKLTAEARERGATYKIPGTLSITSEFKVRGDSLIWLFGVKNLSSQPIELGDESTPLPMNNQYTKKDGMTNSVLKHSFVSGDGTFIFWERPNTIGPYLMLTPEKGTAPEFWDASRAGYQIYVHSKAAGDVAASKGSHWRIPQTSVTLAPGASTESSYAFHWAKDYNGVRNILAKSGQVDVQVVPGMTVPNDVDAEVALRTDRSIQGIEPEFPDQTKILKVGNRRGTAIYKIAFGKLGENRLTVHYGNGLKTYLEFFSTEPVETLINKRGAFLARSQHKDPTKWYNGLISEWNMDNQTLLGPENYDRITGWRIYEVSCDDPGIGKPSFLAAKNAEYPVQEEVTALDDYIEYFVWGGLQQKSSEPFPYAIYGIPDWKTLRESKKPKLSDGVQHIWRCYDYPHVVLLYESMYKMASKHPEMKTRLKPLDYLERAYGTAEAMFTIPAKIVGWSAYETGYYNEVVLLDVIRDLDANGMHEQAATLRKHWEDKTKFFVLGRPDLFGSEYAFDSTAFESTHAIARYAMNEGSHMGISKEKARKFLDEQIALNMFCRGSIEPAYYYLGSDYRGGAGNGYTLSYMSQMGGWGILDYGLHYASEPASYVRLGYASYLSSWALMNTGTAESNYGFWYPGKANDGGAGGGFEPAAYGKTWLDQPHHRGSWYYGCEIDLGYSGALRTAATVVTDDPIFGRICLGGTGVSSGDTYRFVPRDGLRKRLYVRAGSVHGDFVLNGARYVSGKDVSLDTRIFSMKAEVACDSSLPAKLEVSGLPEGSYSVQVDGGMPVSVKGGDQTTLVDVPAGSREFVIRRG